MAITQRIAQLEEDMFEADADLFATVQGTRIVLKKAVVGNLNRALAYWRIATSVSGAWQFLVISFLADLLAIIVRGLLSMLEDISQGLMQAVGLAAKGIRHFAKAQVPMYKKAVKRTVATVIREKVQEKVIQENLVQTLTKQGWKKTTEAAIQAVDQGPPKGEGIRAFGHHVNEIADAEDLLAQLKAEPNQTERLLKSTAKVEHYLELLKQAHTQTDYGNYNRQQQGLFGVYRKMFRKAARGKGPKGRGGAYGVMAHQRLKRRGDYRRDCINTAKQSLAIGKASLKLASAAVTGNGQQALSTVINYVAQAWSKADPSCTKPSSQKYELTAKDNDQGFGITSKQTEKRGSPKLIDGIEDTDAFSPGSVSEAIAIKALQIFNGEMRAYS